jgi:ATP-binding cassette subfamily F protein uup
LNILEEYLIGFKGNLIIITHDRYFMDKIADHIFIMDGTGEIKVFNGTFTDYRIQSKTAQKPETRIVSARVEEKNQLRTEKKKLNNEIVRISREIELCEAEKAEIMDFFSKGEETDMKTIESKGNSLKVISDKIKELETKWEELVEKLDFLESETQ